MQKSLEIRVEGKVQGVWFRKYTQQKAQSLNLLGTVRNMQDGSVFVEVIGDTEVIAQFVDWLHEGSPESNVTAVLPKEVEPKSFDSFEIIR